MGTAFVEVDLLWRNGRGMLLLWEARKCVRTEALLELEA